MSKALPHNRWRLIARLAAEVILALISVGFIITFIHGYRNGETDSQANLFFASVPAALGLVGWWFPRIVAAIALIFATLLALIGAAYAGSWLGLLLGVPIAVPGGLLLVSWTRSSL